MGTESRCFVGNRSGEAQRRTADVCRASSRIRQPIRPGLLLVLPRLGTQSPWSTKATDIAHLCDLDSVSRIERGIIFHLPPDAVETGLAAIINPLIHDRMTQTVLTDLNTARALFAHHPARPLVIADLSGDALLAL